MRTLFTMLIAITALLYADDEPKVDANGKVIEGHSVHGEAFNEGPRQQAYLMDGMPKINFPVSTKDELAQKFFNQGVAQLHGFWYFESERSFRQAAAIDPDLAMAYWGMAMSNIKNPKRAVEFVKQAVERKKFADKRECMWIDSLAEYYQKKGEDKERRRNLVRALENICVDYPDDIEAKAFLVFQIWDNADHGIPLNSHFVIEKMIREILAKDPMHPAHHYRIHLWNGEKDERALPSAALCGQCSPGIAHMWHMPGHTYSKLQRYADAAWQQEASARVDHAQMMRDHVLPDQIHNFAHNNEWLAGNLSYIGRVHDAIELSKNMIELPRLPKFEKEVDEEGHRTYDASGSSYSKGRGRLVELLTQFEMWDEIIELSKTSYLAPGDKPQEQMARLEALGVAYFNRGDVKKAAEQQSALEELLKDLREKQKTAGASAETKAKEAKKNADETKKAKEDAERSIKGKIEAVEKAIAELKVYETLAQKKNDDLKSAIEKAKDIPKTRQAQIWFAAGDNEKAITLAREAQEKASNQIQPLANYVDILNRAGKKKEAQEQFERLRKMSAYINLDLPVIKRLALLADELKLPHDWRVKPAPATDVGVRPELSTLGPIHWQPSAAPDFVLPDSNGKSLGLNKYRGKPVVVIFYLGRKCSHCMEQINLFAPMEKKFADAGISLVGISTDSIEDAKQTLLKSGDKVPFPLLSDQNFGVFKSYRAYDDFEKTPLHGTFLIDGNGLVRWQDISFDPFREPEFLLSEAKRLLAFGPNEPPKAEHVALPPTKIRPR